LVINVFDVFTGKHNDFLSKNDYDLMSITNNLFHFEQTNEPDKCYLKNNKNNIYYEIAYPFIKRIKLKHDPEAGPEKKPVQYTLDIIVEIKNRDGTVVPIRALLDTGTTSTIILRELLGKGIARTNTKKRTKWKTLGGTFTTNYESVLDFKFPEISTSKVVTWQAHVDYENSSKEVAYDMIMGMDLMTFIGITVDFEQRCIRWGAT
jgi:predicted aspartyl protease